MRFFLTATKLEYKKCTDSYAPQPQYYSLRRCKHGK